MRYNVALVICLTLMCLITFAGFVAALLFFNAERYGWAMAQMAVSGFGAGLCFAAFCDWFIFD